MREVAVLGLGMHPWGKFPDTSVTKLCRVAVEAALADAADLFHQWRMIEAFEIESARSAFVVREYHADSLAV